MTKWNEFITLVQNIFWVLPLSEESDEKVTNSFYISLACIRVFVFILFPFACFLWNYFYLVIAGIILISKNRLPTVSPRKKNQMVTLYDKQQTKQKTYMTDSNRRQHHDKTLMTSDRFTKIVNWLYWMLLPLLHT